MMLFPQKGVVLFTFVLCVAIFSSISIASAGVMEYEVRSKLEKSLNITIKANAKDSSEEYEKAAITLNEVDNSVASLNGNEKKSIAKLCGGLVYSLMITHKKNTSYVSSEGWSSALKADQSFQDAYASAMKLAGNEKSRISYGIAVGYDYLRFNTPKTKTQKDRELFYTKAIEQLDAAAKNNSSDSVSSRAFKHMSEYSYESDDSITSRDQIIEMVYSLLEIISPREDKNDTFISRKWRFRISRPDETWKIIENDLPANTIVAMAKNTTGKEYPANITLMVVPLIMEEEGIDRMFFSYVQNNLENTGYTITGNINSTFKNYDAREIASESKLSSGADIGHKTLAFIIGNTGFIVSFNSEKTNYENMLPVFDKIMNTFDKYEGEYE